jgi:cellulose synthase/poly-beta-1,6-N-acetylglucosamine synthase-like glycosyltransferase
VTLASVLVSMDPLQALSVAYLGIFLTYAVLHEWRARGRAASGRSEQHVPVAEMAVPNVDVIVPCYNETPELLEACCASLVRQEYGRPLRVWLVDDGSVNRAELERVYCHYQERVGWRVLRLPRNVGKRLAQDAAFRCGTGEIVVMVDSDTSLASDAIAKLVAAFEDGVGAVTANVRAVNAGHNLLTKLVDTRYRLLFEHERAVEGSFSAVLCCSGPYAAYRRAALAQIWESYLGETFGDRPLVFGDDLALTMLVLKRGHQSVYEPLARARTKVPSTLREYARQQRRWNKSLYCYLGSTVGVSWRTSPLLCFHLLARTVLPLLFGLILVVAIGGVALGGSYHGALAVLAILLVAHFVLVMRQTHDVGFFLGYGLVHVGLLIPVRVMALLTLADSRWGTRDSTPRLRSRVRTARLRLLSARFRSRVTS